MERVKTMSNKLNQDLIKRLYYFSTFDGCLHTTKGSSNPVLIVNMLEKHFDYIDKVDKTLCEIPLSCNITWPKIYIKDGYNRMQQIRLQSKSHPVLKQIQNRIYINSCKVLDPHMLKMLDAEALAIIFMADGSRQIDKRWENAKPNYRLHLNAHSYGDLMLLKKAIKEKFQLEINAHHKRSINGYDLAFPTKFSKAFEEVVSDHVLETFQYKLGR
jgi:hypothetical protein